MLKKLSALALAALLLHPLVCVQSVFAKPNPAKEARLAEKVKDGIRKLGVGEQTRVSVKLRDRTKLTGFISTIEEDHFAITNAKTGVVTTVAYPDVTQVRGNNLSTGAKIAIGIAIGVGATLLALYLISLSFD